ncbi:MAG: hypothetical protein WD794_14360 [Mycobacteriales bacterium]
MTLLIALSVFEIVLLVAVLAFFVIRITKLLRHISTNLAKITWGVRTLVTQCGAIGPAADQINSNLAATAADLERAAVGAERLSV